MNLPWLINRLRAMGLAEIVHRIGRGLGQHAERVRLALGWRPRPPGEVRHAVSLFPADVEGWREQWGGEFSLQHDDLEELLEGRLGFFGHPKLDIGKPVQWHRDPLQGTTAPLGYGKTIDYRDDRVVGDIKVLWELGRHQHLVALAVAFAVTDDSRYRDEIGSQIRGWIADNPFGSGIHWCSSLEVALRVISWSIVHSMLMLRDGRGGLFDLLPAGDFGESLFQHGWFIRHHLSRHSSANNHLIGELVGLFTVSCVFDLGEEGARWRDFARGELELESGRQVFPDGVSREQACYYHLWVLEYLLFARLVGERAGQPFSATFRSRTDRMADFLRDLAAPGGRVPEIGDSDDGFVVTFTPGQHGDAYEDVLAAESVVRTGSAPGPCTQKAFWYGMMAGRLPATAIDDPSPMRTYPRVYPDGGYAILGSGRDHLVFDSGPLGYLSLAAHGHADALSFCLAVNGEWWLVDPGTYAYHSLPEWRNYFRGTAAHNTIQVDRCDQSTIGGNFLWTRHARAALTGPGVDTDGQQWVRGTHDGYRRLGVEVSREVRYFPERREIEIHDEVRGPGNHAVAIHFHLAPGISLVMERPGVWTARKDGSSARVEFKLDESWAWRSCRGSDDPPLGWYSGHLGTKEPIETLEGSWNGTLPIILTSRLGLSPTRDPPSG